MELILFAALMKTKCEPSDFAFGNRTHDHSHKTNGVMGLVHRHLDSFGCLSISVHSCNVPQATRRYADDRGLCHDALDHNSWSLLLRQHEQESPMSSITALEHFDGITT